MLTVALSSSFTQALDDLQDRLQEAFQAFLNGDFIVPGSRRADLMRPLRLSRYRVPWDVLGAPVEAFGRLGSPAGARATDISEIADLGLSRRWLTFDESARLLSGLYRALDQLLDETEPTSVEEIRVLRRYDPETYRAHGLAAVERLAAYAQRALADEVAGFYLHGSLSTLDYTDYSDVDDFIVVRRETVLSPEALARCAAHCLEASRFLYEHDLLHHHRHYAVTEIDLRRYPPAYLPPEVLRYATAMLGPTTLRLRPRDSSASHRAALRSLARGLAALGDPARAAANIWQLKTLVSTVLLLPVIYLETLGTYCYKKFSFDLARPAFGPAWTTVELASQIRMTWRYEPDARERFMRRLVLDGLGNPALFQHAMARWSQPVPQKLRDLLRGEEFYQKVAALGETTLRLLDEPPASGLPPNGLPPG